jgi:histidinol-phosphate phosphatase family protein
MTADFAIVIPTIGRASLHRLLAALDGSSGPRPVAVVVVDDRARANPPLELSTSLPATVVRSGGRGPAAARNVGWRSTRAEWICFVDDDVIPHANWLGAVAEDIAEAERIGAAGSQAVIEVPRVAGRRATDDEQRTQRLGDAQWITADMAFTRSVLVAVGGFDERFRRAYREDSDIALRIIRAGNTIARGARCSTHPVAVPSSWLSSVRAQIGNQDNALMRRKHGPSWRDAVGEGPGRMPAHAATTAAALSVAVLAVTGRWRAAVRAAALWVALTAEFTSRRILAGPRTISEIARMAVTSVMIPPVAVYHRIRGEWDFRSARRDPPLAVLLDRDDTIIEDRHYLNDPGGVQPMAGADDALRRLRERGLLLGIVSNQSGVAKGLITHDELAAVNARVDQMLGPFDAWQVCMHDDADGCGCRKPAPGMVLAAADALGVDAARCVVIGDTGGDVNAALSAGADAVLVPTERTLRHEISDAQVRARVAADLNGAVSMVLKECR